MDRQLLARLIGAGVLVVALVIVAPAILDGDSADEAAVAETGSEPRRTHTIRLDQATKTPPVAREVAAPASEPVRPSAAPGTESERIAKVAPPSAEPAAAAPETSKPVRPKPAPVPTPESVATTPAKPAGASAPPRGQSMPVPKSGWVVQLGSFSSRQNAQRLASEVNSRGFSAFLMPLDRRGKPMYRVRVGPRDTRAQAAELAGRLAKVGYTGQVTRQQPDA